MSETQTKLPPMQRWREMVTLCATHKFPADWIATKFNELVDKSNPSLTPEICDALEQLIDNEILRQQIEKVPAGVVANEVARVEAEDGEAELAALLAEGEETQTDDQAEETESDDQVEDDPIMEALLSAPEESNVVSFPAPQHTAEQEPAISDVAVSQEASSQPQQVLETAETQETKTNKKKKTATAKEPKETKAKPQKLSTDALNVDNYIVKNVFSGKEKKLSQIERRLALHLLRKKNLAKDTKQNNNDISALENCYKSSIFEAVRPELSKLRKEEVDPETGETTVKWIRKSILGNYLKYSAETTGGVTQTDKLKTEQWLAEMTDEEAQLYPGLIEKKFTLNKAAIEPFLKRKEMVPGYALLPTDDFGSISFKLESSNVEEAEPRSQLEEDELMAAVSPEESEEE